MSSLTLTPAHGYLVVSSSAICFYGLLAGGLYVGGVRSATFGAAWAKSEKALALAETHKKEGCGEFPKNGYPDMGSGLFSQTLTYGEWYKFNNAQRAHYNLVENFAPALGLHVLAGLFFPAPVAASSALWIAARHVWASNYATVGPNGRYGGIAGLHAACLLGWFGAAVYGGLKLAKAF
jgi:hypothetical protein